MNINITFRHMDGTEAMKKYAIDKTAKLQKFLRQNMAAQITLSVEGLDHIAEVQLSSGGMSCVASERRDDMYASIDVVIDKLERQIRAQKGAAKTKKRQGQRAGEFAATIEREVESQRSRG